MKHRPEDIRILVVEDSPTQAEVLRTILETEGYKVEVARDGEEGLERFKAGGIDLVLSDVIMPGISGFELCRRIKADPAGRDLPVIMLTSLSDPMDIIQGLEAGADNFITKPYESAYLLGRVSGILAAREPSGEEKVRIGASLTFMGRSVTITSAKQQILSLLVTTFEEAVRKSRELEGKQRELEQANALLQEYARQAKGLARVSSEKYAILMEQAHDGICLLDEQGLVVEANRQMLLLAGFSREDAVGRHFREFVPEASREQRVRDFQEVLAQGAVRLDAMGLLRANGESTVVDLMATAVRLEGKVFILMIARDATERVATERRIEVQRAAVEVLANAGSFEEAAPRLLESVCTVLGWQWAVLWSMDEARKGMGFQAAWAPPGTDMEPYLREAKDTALGLGEGLPGRAWESRQVVWIADLSRDGNLVRTAPVTSRVLEAGIRTSVAIPIICEGAVVAVMILGRREPGEPDERLIRTFMILGDYIGQYIERKRSEEILRESEARFRTLFENAVEGIVVADIETRAMRYANPAACTMFGYPAGGMVGLGLKDLHPAESMGLVLGEFAAQARKEKVLSPSLPCRRKDDTVFFADVSAAPAVVDGLKCSVGFFTDTTEKRVLEEQFRQSQKLDAIGRLAAGVAHDFNNMLTAIFGYADILSGKLEDASPLRQYVDRIRAAGERAAGLTRQLLTFSRKQAQEMNTVDLNDVVRDLSGMLQRILGEDVKQVLMLEAGLGKVLADSGQMGQVIMNLAVNARDAMPQGGDLTIETANVELDEEYVRMHVASKAGRYVMLAVSDTGCGMDEGTRKRIFEPFFTTKEKGKGTGLGLATVYGIVKQSNGSIWVYSEPGKGTTFKIYLPEVESRGEPARPAKAHVVAKGGGETVLVVEDDPVLLLLAVEVLKEKGYRVIGASGLEEARKAAAAESRIDLLLTDVIMPSGSGKEVSGMVLSSHPKARVMFMSGYTDGSIAHHGISGGGAVFLPKPFTPHSLASRVREVLDAGAVGGEMVP